MKTFALLDNLEFNQKNPNAQPLSVTHDGRVLRFALRPGQVVQEHQSPNSPVYITVLQGEGMFAGPDGVEQRFGPQALIIFDAGEMHSIRALDEDLVFIAYMHGVPHAD